MTWRVRTFLCVFALTLVFISIEFDRTAFALNWSSFCEFWALMGGTTFAYALLAMAAFRASNVESTLRPAWMVPLWIVLLSQFFAMAVSGTPTNGLRSFLIRICLVFIPFAAYLIFSAWLLRSSIWTHVASSGQKRRRVLTQVALCLGTVLVLSSLGVDISAGTGWRVMLGRSGWITGEFHVGRGLFGPDQMKYLGGVYAFAGANAYRLTLIAVVAFLVWLLGMRFSTQKLQSARILPYFTVLFSALSMGLYSDVFWGWHFGSTPTIVVILVALLWLAVPVFALVLLGPLTRMRQMWRIRLFTLFQIPQAAFTYLTFSLLFLPESTHFPGVGLLTVGLQLLSWACMFLMFPPREAPDVRPLLHDEIAAQPVVSTLQERDSMISSECGNAFQRYQPFMFIEPVHRPTECITDSLTRKATALLRKARVLNSWFGYHVCICGAQSGTDDLWFEIRGQRMMTHSLLIHYVAYHREEVPPDALEMLATLTEEAEPTCLELRTPEHRDVCGRPNYVWDIPI